MVAEAVEPALFVASLLSFGFNKIRGFSVVNLLSSLFVFFAKIMGRFGSCNRKTEKKFTKISLKNEIKWVFLPYFDWIFDFVYSPTSCFAYFPKYARFI